MVTTLYEPPAASGIERSQRLAGRTALVTGGARRIGAGIVRALHGAGANVVIHCHRSLAAARALAAELEAARAGSTAVDRLRSARCGGAAAADRRHACERFGALHLLVNNASTFYPTPLGSITSGPVGRSDRHQSARTAVPGAGRGAGAAAHAAARC